VAESIDATQERPSNARLSGTICKNAGCNPRSAQKNPAFGCPVSPITEGSVSGKVWPAVGSSGVAHHQIYTIAGVLSTAIRMPYIS
jgi:hypothetical protein